MLWRFGFHHVSKVEILLEKEGGTSVEELFNEDDLLTEVKSHNHKLMEFLSERTNIRKLVDYIVDGDVKTSKKEITLATDILTSDNWPLRDALITENSISQTEPSSNFTAPIHLNTDENQNFEQSQTESDNSSNTIDSPINDTAEINSSNQIPPTSISDLPDLALQDPQMSNSSSPFKQEDPELLFRLWSILYTPKGELEYLRASCFSRIVSMLLQYKKSETLEFIMNQDNIIESFMKHLEFPPVMELLLKLAGLDEVSAEYGVSEWLSEQKLIQQLVDSLDPKNDEDIHFLGTQVILDLIVISHCANPKQEYNGRNLLMDELKSPEVMDTLLRYMLDSNEDNSCSSFVNGVYILVELIRRSCSEPDQDIELVQSTAGEDLIDMMKAIKKRIGILVGLLDSPRSKKIPVRTTVGVQVPLGFERLRVCELLAEVLHCSKMTIFNIDLNPNSENDSDAQSTQDLKDIQSSSNVDQEEPVGRAIRYEYSKKQVLVKIVDLFFEYPWNNFLHSVVYDILHQVLTLPTDDESNIELIVSLFKDAQITYRIATAALKNSCSSQIRMGYMGHLLGIAEEIVRLLELDDQNISPLLISHIDQNSWDNFVENALREAKERDLVNIDYKSNGSEMLADNQSEEYQQEFDFENRLEHEGMNQNIENAIQNNLIINFKNLSINERYEDTDTDIDQNKSDTDKNTTELMIDKLGIVDNIEYESEMLNSQNSLDMSTDYYDLEQDVNLVSDIPMMSERNKPNHEVNNNDGDTKIPSVDQHSKDKLEIGYSNENFNSVVPKDQLLENLSTTLPSDKDDSLKSPKNLKSDISEPHINLRTDQDSLGVDQDSNQGLKDQGKVSNIDNPSLPQEDILDEAKKLCSNDHSNILESKNNHGKLKELVVNEKSDHTEEFETDLKTLQENNIHKPTGSGIINLKQSETKTGEITEDTLQINMASGNEVLYTNIGHENSTDDFLLKNDKVDKASKDVYYDCHGSDDSLESEEVSGNIYEDDIMDTRLSEYFNSLSVKIRNVTKGSKLQSHNELSDVNYKPNSKNKPRIDASSGEFKDPNFETFKSHKSPGIGPRDKKGLRIGISDFPECKDTFQDQILPNFNSPDKSKDSLDTEKTELILEENFNQSGESKLIQDIQENTNPKFIMNGKSRRRSRSQSAGVGVSRSMAVAGAASGLFVNIEATTSGFVGHIQGDDLITENVSSNKSSLFKQTSNASISLSSVGRPSPTLYGSSTFGQPVQHHDLFTVKGFTFASGSKDTNSITKESNLASNDISANTDFSDL
ncbi:hypothetical protein BB558_005743 [Smittium angustum]|uniref:Extragenic suppressor of kinetochore protein 1 n=1 Tax=Smittium angustum TaxID=133377 RepID=A0A2U1IZL1_SMIAN|nr:hypothetical protein BB558_005743 [Smittium angustum]